MQEIVGKEAFGRSHGALARFCSGSHGDRAIRLADK
jgi:hypothetical protein